ncbi:p45 [Spodoptera frugiperda multiple nucleopolyhedrovirus]|uniref:p45 n=1 Tax=Spodoptera frugiperda nuclear polyhedrosis virus TaxID=10455 RepID=A1YJ52_NPVSF|nr:p45 [Spodoptera frugiperda multiple nucleopolyhedrovirus]ABM45772.1 p45 [Spodoptera frugiperda multiple nucleopolyhedrovirus]ACA02619.1 P45 [Spodoptera frugiperda multiple nucleopolyhedrovirus]ADV91295.1 p48 [Spodoptera frugiperda multiple nucleopolyhedrovirus]AFH59088.1 p48 [Spodoptera frugiperda multiple nucleopolyhedrovirus]AIW01473.1 P45 protein [Spodoptera frugiperda multiple nucleopolyhedrovirus]
MNPVEYTLRFNKFDVFINVKFKVNLSVDEIDSLAFLYSKYFNQSDNVRVKGLTFFNEFNKCVEFVKANFESKQENNDVKKIFSIFFKDEFMSQVPKFRDILNYLQKYFKPIQKPNVPAISALCNNCSVNTIACLQCKINYLSESITTFDTGIQDGWDIFLRPMFGLPLLLTVLLKTEFNEEFQVDDLITNSFSQFLYNLLCDKATANFVDHKACAPIIKQCQRVTVSLRDHDLERLLCMLRNNNSCDSKLFMPFKVFIVELARKTKIKPVKINKMASVVFTGFYLRQYLEAAPNKTRTAAELELRNVCRFILNKYTDDQLEYFIRKLENIKIDLFKESMEQYIVSENFIRHLVYKYKLDEELKVLLEENVDTSPLQ